MNIQIQLIGDITDAKMIQVLNALAGGNQVTAAPKKAAAAPAAKVDEDEDAPAEAAAPAAKAAKPAAKAGKPAAKAAKPAAPATMTDDERIEALEAQDADEQLATVQAEVTKHSKKGKTADIKKLLAIFDAPKVSELDPSTYGEFYGLVLRFGAGESADDIVESYEV